MGQKRDGLSRFAGSGGGADRTAGIKGREGTGRREGGEPVRAAHGHHRQGRSRNALRAQDQPDHGAHSGLALDVVVEDGNPADSARCLPMLERHLEHYGAPPSRATFDGGYASRENLKEAKARGIEHVVFHKKRGIKVEDMTSSP